MYIWAPWDHVTGSVHADQEDRCDVAKLGSVGNDVTRTGEEHRAPRLT